MVSDPSPEHVRITVQQSLQCIEDILGLAAGFDTKWIPDDEKQPAFLVGYGLYMATRRLTQAAVLQAHLVAVPVEATHAFSIRVEARVRRVL